MDFLILAICLLVVPAYYGVLVAVNATAGLPLAICGLLLGLVLRVIVPYILEGIQTVLQTEQWSSWPRFSAKYPVGILAAAIPYALALLLFSAAAEWVTSLPFQDLVAWSYGGGDLSRRITAAFVPGLR